MDKTGMNQEKKYGVCVVADDDIGFLDDLCAGLRARNVFKSVMPFARIDEAIAYIRTHSVALFVSDIEFPDGELSYNHLSLIPSVPVILLTVHGRYFMDHFSSIAVNRNIIGTALKIAFPDISQEVVRRYELVKSEGVDKSVIKETATNTIIELYRFDTVNPRSFEVRYSEIAMITVSRQPRGLRFHLNNNLHKYYLPYRSLQECFVEMDRSCPGLFFLIPHKGILNLWNMALSGSLAVSIRSEGVKYELKIPKAVLPTLKVLMDGWTR